MEKKTKHPLFFISGQEGEWGRGDHTAVQRREEKKRASQMQCQRDEQEKEPALDVNINGKPLERKCLLISPPVVYTFYETTTPGATCLSAEA